MAEERGVKVSACHQNRFNIAIQELRKALESGRFGRLSHGSINVRWNRNRGYYDQAPWRGTWAQDGGCLMNQCIHGIDLLRWMMGNEVEEVYGATRQQFHDYLEEIGYLLCRIYYSKRFIPTSIKVSRNSVTIHDSIIKYYGFAFSIGYMGYEKDAPHGRCGFHWFPHYHRTN